ncbi:hypothetical protein SAMN04488130_11170 [Flavobacterium urumqiense]|uniref:Uncharacterized protein n=1 Tax=Flavobacterium urumqiense TaxID=935224 RepID=A0A1H5ZPM5_9FLAO|nr:hypothetical protein SAMN04488130_11170 [Flavobacterium urumqiense]
MTDLKQYIGINAKLIKYKDHHIERKPGITTFGIGIQKFSSIMQNCKLFKDMYRR